MNRQTKLWQALLAAFAAALGTYLGVPRPAAPPRPAPPPRATPNAPPELDPRGGQPADPAPRPAPPVAPAPHEAAPDPVAAIGRIQFGSSGCTATVIGPRRGDGRWDVLTASHCVSRVGQRGTLWLKDGRQLGVTVTLATAQVDRNGPDCCWLVTDSTTEVLPFARLAPRNPAVGTKVWHMGYGVDRPGNREDGTVTAGQDANGQLEFRISVSSGDSGGGIAVNESGEIVGAVCCTTARGQVARVWACSPETAGRLRPKEAVALERWTPIEIPLVPDATPAGAAWTPVDMPVVVVPDVMPARPGDLP